MSLKVPKKIAALHDIAGFGRSSLTVVIPVMSAMGHQTCPVPTAVLSTITGFYEDYAMLDLSELMPEYLKHWEKENLKFDCIYSGFLGSASQAEITSEFIDRLKTPLNVVDPVFADDGKLYACFDLSIVSAMKKLSEKADIITPNATEVYMMLGESAPPEDEKEAVKKAKSLSKIGPSYIIITSVPDGEGNICVVVYDKIKDTAYKISNPYIHHAHYPGTGDLFTSVLTGHMLNGHSVAESASKAADFVFMSVKTACTNGVPVREGIPLELMLPRLLEDHGLKITEI
ncbi:MAG: pyridoxamine kinase [Clostridia bacterium]|nr:pyridoxamine kinase [Clostridia bacterium]